MHFYGMGYETVLDLPISTFWLMSSNIGKITAESDIRKFTLMLESQMGGSAEGVKGKLDALRKEMGTPIKRAVVLDGSDLDSEGLAALKMMT